MKKRVILKYLIVDEDEQSDDEIDKLGKDFEKKVELKK